MILYLFFSHDGITIAGISTSHRVQSEFWKVKQRTTETVAAAPPDRVRVRVRGQAGWQAEEAPRHHPGRAHLQAQRWPADGMRLCPVRVRPADGPVHAPGQWQQVGGTDRRRRLADAQETYLPLALLVVVASHKKNAFLFDLIFCH